MRIACWALAMPDIAVCSRKVCSRPGRGSGEGISGNWRSVCNVSPSWSGFRESDSNNEESSCYDRVRVQIWAQRRQISKKGSVDVEESRPRSRLTSVSPRDHVLEEL